MNLTCALCISLALLGSATARAQNIADLEARIRALEAMISPANGVGSTLRAPFKIVNSQGHAVLEVVANADGMNVLRLGQLNKGSAVQLEQGPNRAVVVAALGSDEASLRAISDGPRVDVYAKDFTGRVGSGSDGSFGVYVLDAGTVPPGGGVPVTKPLGEIAARKSETAVLRLRDLQGQVVLSAGSNKARNGLPQIGMNAAGQKIGLLLTAGTTGDGEVGIYSNASGKEVIRLDGQEHSMKLFNRGGTTAASISLSQNGSGPGGNFTAFGASGGVVSAGSTGTGGAVCANHAKRGTQCFP